MMMKNKLFKSIKSIIPKKIRNKIFLGAVRWKEKTLSVLLYMISYFKVKYFLILYHPPKEISAMLRVKNEEEYLYNSVTSIIDYVDEVVLVDNQSTDRSPEIIKQLKNMYPQKIKSYNYLYPMTKVGKPSKDLALKNKKSPFHIVNFTNWCLGKCTKPYILHWAGDHLATPEMKQSIKKFKESPHQLYFSRGLNIYPDLKHSIRTIKNKHNLEKYFFGGAFDNYLTKNTFNECRIFPKKFSCYSFDFPYLESFTNPFLSFTKYIYFDKKIMYLHLKFCKKDPYQILSNDLKNVITQKLEMGEKLNKKYLKLISNFNIQSNNDLSKIPSLPSISKRPLMITIDGDGFCWKNSKNQLTSQLFYEEIMKKYPFLKAHGYVTSKDREDYRLSIEGLKYKTPLNKEIPIKVKKAFERFSKGSDSYTEINNILYSWWD